MEYEKETKDKKPTKKKITSEDIGKNLIKKGIEELNKEENNPNANVLYVTSEDFTNQVIESIRRGKDSQTEMIKFREELLTFIESQERNVARRGMRNSPITGHTPRL